MYVTLQRRFKCRSKFQKDCSISGDGQISFDELESVVHLEKEPTLEEKCERAFREIDTDGNGLIGPEELYNAFYQLGEEMSAQDIAKLTRVFDWDADGYITLAGMYYG